MLIGYISSDDGALDDVISHGNLNIGIHVVIHQHDDDDDDLGDKKNDHLIFPSGEPKDD